MGFELEPLEIDTFEVRAGKGYVEIRRAGHPALEITAREVDVDDFAEFQKTLNAIAHVLKSFRTPPSPQQIARLIRLRLPGTRFQTIYKAIECLTDRDVIHGAAARRFIDLMRDDFRWHRSLLNQPLVEWRLRTPYLGPARRDKFTAVVTILSALGCAVLVALAHRFLTEPAPPPAPLPWAFQALLTLSLGRVLSGALQTFLLAWQSGRAQTLRLQLTMIGFSGEWHRAQAQAPARRPFLLASVAALAATPIVALLCLPGAEPVALGCIAVIFLTGLSPFADSRFVEYLRLTYSTGNELKEFNLTTVLTTTGTVWILIAGAIGATLFSLLQDDLRTLASADPLGSMLGLWFVAVIVVAWVEDVYRGASHGMETDPTQIRRRFFLRSARNTKKSAAEHISQPDLWHTLPLLRQLDAGLRKAVLQNAKTLKYSKGQKICRQGENRRELFILLSGEAAVVRRAENGNGAVVAILEENSVFGEAGFFLGIPRTADVIATATCVVLTVSPETKAQIPPGKFSELQKRIWFLQAVHYNKAFRDIPMEAMDQLLMSGSIRTCPAKTVLLQQGDTARNCFIIIQGTVRILQNGIAINQVSAGDIVGEIALFQDSARTASVVAETEMLVVELDREDFLDFSSRHFAFAMTIEKLTHRRLKADDSRRSRAS